MKADTRGAKGHGPPIFETTKKQVRFKQIHNQGFCQVFERK